MKHTGKGWNRLCKTWIATAANGQQRSVYREAIRQKDQEEWPTHEEIVPLAKGVDGRGKWWGKRDRPGA